MWGQVDFFKPAENLRHAGPAVKVYFIAVVDEAGSLKSCGWSFSGDVAASSHHDGFLQRL